MLKLGYYNKTSHYVWILQDWYADRWWEASAYNDVEADCADKDLETFLDGAISIRTHPSPNDFFSTTDYGIVSAIILFLLLCVCSRF